MQEPQLHPDSELMDIDVQADLPLGEYLSLAHMKSGMFPRTLSLRVSRPLEDVTLRLLWKPAIVQEQRVWISHLAAGVEQTINLPEPHFDADALLALQEETDGTLKLELQLGRPVQQSISRRFDFGWLPAMDARVIADYPELAAALTLPSDPAVEGTLATLRAVWGMPAGAPWPGYAEDAAAIVLKLKELYAAALNVPRRRAQDGLLHTPTEVQAHGYADSRDAALYMAAHMARMCISPILVQVNGEPLLCACLRRETLPVLPETTPDELRTAIVQRALLPISPAALCAGRAFDEAVAEGAAELERADDRADVDILDIEYLWQSGIRPICGAALQPNVTGIAEAEARSSLVSSQAHTRVEKWQRKLLDLSLRNNLLNTRASGKNQMPLIVPSVAKLEDMLTGGATFRFAPLPEGIAGSEEDLSTAPEALEAGAALFRKRTLLADANAAALERTLKALYSSSRREMEESGANTLFIACGFLNWVPKGAAAPLRAPLLLLPVRLNRSSVRDGFSLNSMDEEAQVNQTLLELLKKEFGIRMPELEGDLPKDDSGLDVPLIFETVSRAVAELPGWEVVDASMLGIFSFAKFLMWRDLCDRGSMLMENAVVRQLAAEDRGRFPEQVDFPDPASLDNSVDAHKVYTPLAADSSQLAAILAAARGKSFVLEGPPGTGKSQTIANMIAHCLGHGKTVLFVAEKAVALEVVYKRLARIGLGDFCLELHSNKTLLSAVMSQFREAVAGTGLKPARDEWHESVDTMTGLREELNALPREMHDVYPDGTTLYGCICTLAEYGDLPRLNLLPEGTDPLALPRDRRLELLSLAHELTAHAELVAGEAALAARDVLQTTHSPAWEAELAAALQQAAQLSRQRDASLSELAALLGVETEAAAQRPVFLAAVELAAELPGVDWRPLLPAHAGRVLRTLRVILPHAQEYRRLRATLSMPYADSAARDPELGTRLAACRQAQSAGLLSRWWTMYRTRSYLRKLAAGAADHKPDCLHDLATLVAMQAELTAVEQADAAALPEFLRKGVETTKADAARAERWITMLDAEDDTFALDLHARRARLEDDARLLRPMDAFRELHGELAALEPKLAELLGAPTRLQAMNDRGRGAQWAERLLHLRGKWRGITLWNRRIAAVRAAHAGELADALLTGQAPAEAAELLVEVSLAHAKLCAADEVVETLRDFVPPIHRQRILDFMRHEGELRSATGSHIRSLLAARAAGISRFDRESAILQREVSKKRMYMPLRKLLAATPNITPLLKPCFLMSPLSVAQYLTADAPAFDVVIFDEASQIPVWDAIGAIARGKSVIITGDSRQMPPTSFFSRSRSEDEAEDEGEPELESILDECLACGVPKLDLTWHYRSRSESLIAFSNAHYYEGKMTTFPAPALQDTALQLHYVGGLYEPGATRRVNAEEARAVVRHVVDSLRVPGFRYTEATSIGIVTFNTQQQKLISDMLDEERSKDPALEPFFAEDNPEAIFVKNLENVQGDERGIIYFSTTYGRDAAGRMSMNFGPLNLTGGERRLNVAITRARYGMHLFTSMQPEDINLSRTRARGVADLRAFLEYAAQGSRLAAGGVSPSRRDALAQHIARCIEAHGFTCRTGVGASDYQVDIAVENPDVPNAVLAGLTLDGPSYRAAHTARDRDVVRPETMRLLGWRMLDVWAIDWWRDPEGCLQAILDKLTEFRAMGPPAAAELPDLLPGAADPQEDAAEEKPTAEPPPELGSEYTPYIPAKPLPGLFRMGDAKLEELVRNIIKAESPIPQDYLLTRLTELAPIQISQNTRAYRDQLTGIELRVHDILHAMVQNGAIRMHREDTTDGAAHRDIISLCGSPAICPRSRGPRSLEQIPLSELGEISRRAQVAFKCLPGSDDHLRGIASFLTLGRLTKKVKDALLFATVHHTASTDSATRAEQEHA